MLSINLGLLYALNSDPSLIAPPFWPDFGSNIIFEISENLSIEQYDSPDSKYKANLYFNMEPLSIEITENKIDLNNQSTYKSSISLSVLRNIFMKFYHKSQKFSARYFNIIAIITSFNT